MQKSTITRKKFLNSDFSAPYLFVEGIHRGPSTSTSESIHISTVKNLLINIYWSPTGYNFHKHDTDEGEVHLYIRDTSVDMDKIRSANEVFDMKGNSVQELLYKAVDFIHKYDRNEHWKDTISFQIHYLNNQE